MRAITRCIFSRSATSSVTASRQRSKAPTTLRCATRAITRCIFSRSSTSSVAASCQRAKAPATVRLSKNSIAFKAARSSSFTPRTCSFHSRSARTAEEFVDICMVRRIFTRSSYASRHDAHPKRANRRSGNAFTRSKHSLSRRMASAY